MIRNEYTTKYKQFNLLSSIKILSRNKYLGESISNPYKISSISLDSEIYFQYVHACMDMDFSKQFSFLVLSQNYFLKKGNI